MKTKLERIEEDGRAMIARAQKEHQGEDWHLIPGWDINAWLSEEDNQWHITLYPATNADTDTDRGIVIRGGHIDGCYDFPSIQTLEKALSDKTAAEELSQWWVVRREGAHLLVSPTKWGKDAPILEIDLQSEAV